MKNIKGKNKPTQHSSSPKRMCEICGWEGLESETGFGHNDYYCPVCKIESLALIGIRREEIE